MVKRRGKGVTATLAEQLITGASKHFASGPPVAFASDSFTPAQITSQLQSIIALRADVEAAKNALKAKLATEAANMPALRDFLYALVAFVKVTYSKSPDVLADFGLTPKKVATPLTVEQKAAAAAKRKATREARHTLGTRQRKAVKGAVTGVVVTPVTAPEAPAK